MKFYVYEHYANNENLQFYVGKGLKARPYAKKVETVDGIVYEG